MNPACHTFLFCFRSSPLVIKISFGRKYRSQPPLRSSWTTRMAWLLKPDEIGRHEAVGALFCGEVRLRNAAPIGINNRFVYQESGPLDATARKDGRSSLAI